MLIHFSLPGSTSQSFHGLLTWGTKPLGHRPLEKTLFVLRLSGHTYWGLWSDRTRLWKAEKTLFILRLSGHMYWGLWSDRTRLWRAATAPPTWLQVTVAGSWESWASPSSSCWLRPLPLTLPLCSLSSWAPASHPGWLWISKWNVSRQANQRQPVLLESETCTVVVLAAFDWKFKIIEAVKACGPWRSDNKQTHLAGQLKAQ